MHCWERESCNDSKLIVGVFEVFTSLFDFIAFCIWISDAPSASVRSLMTSTFSLRAAIIVNMTSRLSMPPHVLNAVSHRNLSHCELRINEPHVLCITTDLRLLFSLGLRRRSAFSFIRCAACKCRMSKSMLQHSHLWHFQSGRFHRCGGEQIGQQESYIRY